MILSKGNSISNLLLLLRSLKFSLEFNALIWQHRSKNSPHPYSKCSPKMLSPHWRTTWKGVLSTPSTWCNAQCTSIRICFHDPWKVRVYLNWCSVERPWRTASCKSLPHTLNHSLFLARGINARTLWVTVSSTPFQCPMLWWTRFSDSSRSWGWGANNILEPSLWSLFTLWGNPRKLFAR